jgi:hypothetical protein
MSSQPSSTLALETLPVDVIRDILLTLPDVASLDKLIRASPACYRVYQASKDFILFKVLRTQISPQVLREALACFQACKLRQRHDDYVEDFLKYYASHGLPASVPERVSRMLIRFHKTVELLTADFCSAKLAQHPMTNLPNVNYKPPSRTEIIRIQRGFYLFQLSCDLFRSRCRSHGMGSRREVDSDSDDESVMDNAGLLKYLLRHNYSFDDDITPLLDCLPSWKVQEFHGIFGYLDICVRKASRHWEDPQFDEGFALYNGLSFFGRLRAATTQDEREEVLESNEGRVCYNGFIIGFSDRQILDDKDFGNDSDWPDDPDFQDNPDQPNYAFLWPKLLETEPKDLVGCVDAYFRSVLRYSGYSMWDKPRLMAWGVLDEPWDQEWHNKWLRRWCHERLEWCRGGCRDIFELVMENL